MATTLVKDRVESENIYRGDYYSGKTNVERSPRRRRPASHTASAEAKLTARKYTHLEKAKRRKATEKFQQRFSNNKRFI